jgi:putative Ca2+/H+ antiporter (TMEM165/GDT1 family)
VNALWTTILLVFVAEFGDKSQLLALSLGARHRLVPVIVGAFFAFAATTLLSVTLGGMISVALPAAVIASASGLVFLGFGLWTLWPVLRRADDPSEEQAAVTDPVCVNDQSGTISRWRVFSLAFVTMFLAEFGDKTMLVSATLATRSNLVVVWIGSTIAMTLSTLIGVSLGRYLTGRISERNLKIGSASLFVIVGIAMVLGGLNA